jgi:predicted acyl esterase
MSIRGKRVVLVGAMGLCALAASSGQSLDGTIRVRASYTKREVLIPMRDGVKLFTAVYLPKDTTRSAPIMLTRTASGVAPYGPDAFKDALGPSRRFEDDGLIFAYQDVRGRHRSEGRFELLRPLGERRGPLDTDESTDAYDTIEWLIKNLPNTTWFGGMWSAPFEGRYAQAAVIGAHPGLKAVSMEAPVSDSRDELYENGAFRLAHATRLFSDLNPRQPLWNKVVAHANVDAYWTARTIRRRVLEVTPAVFTAVRWSDGQSLKDALDVRQALTLTDPDATSTVIVGPPGDGMVRDDYRDRLEFQFFTYHFREMGAPPSKVYAFQTGTDRWEQLDAWPPNGTTHRTLYLRPGGGLGSAPAQNGAPYDEYVSDPAAPVPSDGPHTPTRRDVSVFTSEALPADLAVVGRPAARLWVSTTGTDSDWIVALFDVREGVTQLVRAGAIRARFRDGAARPEALSPHQPTRIDFDLADVNHVFRAGHRIRVHVQSTWFPAIDRNPQTFVPNVELARDRDFRKATQRVYHTDAMLSGIDLLVRP